MLKPVGRPPAPQDVTMKAPAVTMKKTAAADVTVQAPAASVAPTIRATAAAATPPPATPPAAARPAAAPPRPPAAPRHPAPPAAFTRSSPPPPKKGPPIGLILGGAGLLLLAVFVVAGVVAYRKFGGPAETVNITPSAPPTTLARRAPAPAPAALGAIRVVSEPPGATITIDGQPRGVTPADLTDVPLGAHEIKLELRGYAPSAQSVLLSRDAPRSEVSLTLSRTPAATGAAEILSDPPGATVHIDGAPAGQTPYVDPRMKVGTHKVEVVRDGYEPWTGTVTVQAGKKARVDARLRSIAFAAPTPPPVDQVDPNRIYVNSPAEVDTPARKVSGASASYPTGRAPRLRSGDSVSVRLNFVVTETGEVTDLRVVESAGRVVDDAVLNAVRRWKYSPAVKQGTPVKVRVEFRQTFRAG
jgi:TonB family protein